MSSTMFVVTEDKGSKPVRVFQTKEAAEGFINRQDDNWNYTYSEVVMDDPYSFGAVDLKNLLKKIDKAKREDDREAEDSIRLEIYERIILAVSNDGLRQRVSVLAAVQTLFVRLPDLQSRSG